MSEEGTEKVRGGVKPSLSPRLRMGDTWRMIVFGSDVRFVWFGNADG